MLAYNICITAFSFCMCWTSIAMTCVIYPSIPIRALEYIPGLVHACVVCPLSLYFFYTDEAIELHNDIYGESVLLQHVFSISLGFFIYDFVMGVVMINHMFILHGLICSIGTIIFFMPFMQYCGAILILYELSSIPYNIRRLMIYTNNTDNNLFHCVEFLFAGTFVYVRIIIGIPVTIHYSYLAYNDISYDVSFKNLSMVLLIICGNVLSGLNCYWGYTILNKLVCKIYEFIR